MRLIVNTRRGTVDVTAVYRHGRPVPVHTAGGRGDYLLSDFADWCRSLLTVDSLRLTFSSRRRGQGGR